MMNVVFDTKPSLYPPLLDVNISRLGFGTTCKLIKVRISVLAGKVIMSSDSCEYVRYVGYPQTKQGVEFG